MISFPTEATVQTLDTKITVTGRYVTFSDGHAEFIDGTIFGGARKVDLGMVMIGKEGSSTEEAVRAAIIAKLQDPENSQMNPVFGALMILIAAILLLAAGYGCFVTKEYLHLLMVGVVAFLMGIGASGAKNSVAQRNRQPRRTEGKG